MKQIIQDIKKGNTILEEVPLPKVKKGSVLIKVVNSCISAGTEMTSVKASGKSLQLHDDKRLPLLLQQVASKRNID